MKRACKLQTFCLYIINLFGRGMKLVTLFKWLTTMKVLTRDVINLQSIFILPSFSPSYSILLELGLHCLDKDKEPSTRIHIIKHRTKFTSVFPSWQRFFFFLAFQFVLIHPTLIKMPVSFFISRFSFNSLHDLGFIKVLKPHYMKLTFLSLCCLTENEIYIENVLSAVLP